MKWRLIHAYGFPAALVWVVVFLVLGYIFQYATVGITRQPLPMVWPLSVLNVLVALFPLRELLAPMEGVAERGVLSRGLRAGVCSLLLFPALLTYVQHAGREFVVFFLWCAAVGFLAGALGIQEAWAWTLGAGMTIIAVIFVTPVGAAISTSLGTTASMGASIAVTLATVLCYILRPQAHRRWAPLPAHRLGARRGTASEP